MNLQAPRKSGPGHRSSGNKKRIGRTVEDQIICSKPTSEEGGGRGRGSFILCTQLTLLKNAIFLGTRTIHLLNVYPRLIHSILIHLVYQYNYSASKLLTLKIRIPLSHFSGSLIRLPVVICNCKRRSILQIDSPLLFLRPIRSSHIISPLTNSP